MDKELLLAKILECNNYIQYAIKRFLSPEDAEKYRDYRLHFTEEKGAEEDWRRFTLSLHAPGSDGEGSWQYELLWHLGERGILASAETVLQGAYWKIWYQWQAAVLFHGIINLLKKSS